jgi:hypothetical protein
MCEPGQMPAAPVSAADAMAMAQAGLAFLAQADAASLPTTVQASLLAGLEAAEARHTAARARVLAAFAAQRGYEDDAAGSLRTWLMWQTRIGKGAAARAMGWMRRLSAHPRVASALAGAAVSESWAHLICAWTDLLPEDLRDAADAILLAAAADGADLADLAGLAEEMRRRSAQPDADGDDDGFKDRDFRLLRHYRGASRPDGTLTAEATAHLTAALDALNHKRGPEDDRTEGQRNHDALEELCRRALSDGLPDVAGQPAQVQLHLTLEELRDLPGGAEAEAAWAARRGAADSDGETGGLRSRAAAQAYACDAQVTPVVTGRVDPAALAAMTAAFLRGAGPVVPGDSTVTGPAGLTGPGPLHRDTGTTGPGGTSGTGSGTQPGGAPGLEACPAGAACPHERPRVPARTRRRLANTLLWYAADVLSGPDGLASYLRTSLLAAEFPPAVSLPLDVGSSVRTVPPHLRRAVIARDRHCAFPGCRQKPARCQVHHLIPRAKGGPTALWNMTLLCTFHHLIAIHRWGWTLALNGDGTTTATSPDKRKILHSHGPPGTIAA